MTFYRSKARMMSMPY